MVLYICTIINSKKNKIMLYEIKHYENNSYRELLIDVISAQHKTLLLKVPTASYWSRFDTDYLENFMVKVSKLIEQKKGEV